jgi:hypothetical protein
MIWETSAGRPVELTLGAIRNHSKALDAVSVGVVDVKGNERSDRSRSQTITTDLVAPIRRLIKHHHSGTATSGLHRGGGTCGPGTNHEKICLLHTSIVP